MIVAWVLFPLVLVVLCGGAGLLVEWLGGHRLPGALLPALGFCLLVCVTQLAVLSSATAFLATPAAVVVALAGAALGRKRLPLRGWDPWAAALFVVVLLVFGAPSILTGGTTFLGYADLGDASIHFELVDRLMHHGTSIAGLPPSSYAESVNTYFLTSYPTGAHTVLGAGRALVGADVAWLFQPYLALLAALTGLGVCTLTATLTSRRWLAATTAGLVIGAGMVFSYASQQQAIKELATLVTLVTVVGVVAPMLATRPGPRAGIPLVVAAGASLGVLSVAAAPWVGPVLLVAVGLLVWRHRRGGLRPVGFQVAVFVVVGGVLAIPALRSLTAFVDSSNIVLTAVEELGNLQEPLTWWRAFGVWPGPDFRFDIPPDRVFAFVLLGAAVLAATLGLIALLRRRAWPPLLFVGMSLLGFAVVAGRASPWAYGKALMILTPALMLLACAAAIALWEHRRRLEGGLVLVALLIGVGWTDAETYHNVSPAPDQRMRELADIGQRYDGKGPLTYFEFEEFSKHFLRDAAPTGVMEAFRPPDPKGAGGARFGFSSDPDQWDAASLQDTQQLLVTRRGPAISRPPSGFERDFRGHYYDVWERTTSPAVVEHLPLGGRLDAGAVAPCADVRALAERAREAGARLAWAPRQAGVTLRPTAYPPPPNWSVDGTDPELLRPLGPGRVTGSVRVARTGTYHLWLEASVGRPVALFVDDRRVSTVKDELNPRLSSSPAGDVRLTAGRHRVELVASGGSFAPGNGSRQRYIGPLTLTPTADPGAPAIRTSSAAEWRELCGKQLDWIEAIR